MIVPCVSLVREEGFGEHQPQRLVAFREFAFEYLGYTAAKMEELVESGALFRIAPPKENHDA